MKVLKIGLAGILLLISSMGFAEETFNADQQKAIEKIMRDYFVSHPQILIETMQSLQKQQQATWQNTANKVVPQFQKLLFESAISPVIGNPKANVTMVEFFDYQCPHCKEMTPQIAQILKNDSNLKIIFKVLPIFGSSSEYAARAGLAASKQGKYITFHEALMNIQTPLTEDIVLKTAEQIGLNTKQLQEDMKSPPIDQEIKQNNQLAKELNLEGTPAFVIAKISDGKIYNPELIPGAVGENILVQAITKARGE
jgi:protein-disulfide isomerase